MKVCFVSAEPEEKEFFARRLARWEPIFVGEIGEVPEDAGVVSIFIYDGIDQAFLESHPQLRLVATRSSSSDHIDVDACRRHGVRVACVGGSDGNSVAEHTFALLLAVARRLRTSTQLREHGDFSHVELRGFELRGKTLGLIGVGRVGARVVELARAFGMNVVAYDPSPSSSQVEGQGFRYAPMETVLAEAEILSLHAVLTASTRHLINEETLAKCQPGVVIINTARGALIDAAALVAALESGQVGGVGLDVLEDERVLRTDVKNILASEIVERVHNTGGGAVAARPAERQQQIERLFFDSALLARPEVVFTPHIAFNTTETIEAIAGEAAENIEDFLEGRELA